MGNSKHHKVGAMQNIGLMAQKAEEYGSHPTTFELDEAGGSAPKHVDQFLAEGHLKWDSLGEFLALAAKFAPVSAELKAKEATIIEELLAVEGQAQDVGGYFHPNDEMASKAMRPSATLNSIIDGIYDFPPFFGWKLLFSLFFSNSSCKLFIL